MGQLDSVQCSTLRGTDRWIFLDSVLLSATTWHLLFHKYLFIYFAREQSPRCALRSNWKILINCPLEIFSVHRFASVPNKYASHCDSNEIWMHFSSYLIYSNNYINLPHDSGHILPLTSVLEENKLQLNYVEIIYYARNAKHTVHRNRSSSSSSTSCAVSTRLSEKLLCAIVEKWSKMVWVYQYYVSVCVDL